MSRTIPQGQYTHPRFAAESYVGSAYVIGGTYLAPGEYSAHPGDYWHAPDSEPVGPIVRREHAFRTVTGRTVFGPRVLKTDATVGDLRRLARAAESLVR